MLDASRFYAPQDRFGISFPLVEAAAGDVPLPDASFDLVVSECGASLWCDPSRWVPEAARLLRPEEADRGYLSVLEFVDDAAYSAYRASDAFRAAHTWPDHAPIDGSRLTTYHVRSEIPATRAAD